MTRPESYAFGEFVLDVSERRLSRAGQAVALSPKAYDLLVTLVRHAGRLITKRDLLEQVWPESFVEEGILAVHVSGLRKALCDATRPPRFIETVPRSGYRFIASVTRTGVDLHDAFRRWSLAVLPARPLTPASEGVGVSTGLAIADALIDRLGRFDQIVVRPTRAIRAYGSAQHDPADVGRSLRVDAVIDPCFEETGDGIKLSAQLVRSEDGARLWSGEFEEATTERIAIHDAVAESVAAHLGVRMRAARTMVSRPPRKADVYEQVGRGRSHLLSASLSEMPLAEAAFRTAIELDPTYAAAHAGLALTCCAQAGLRAAAPADAYVKAKAAALRALAVDDSCADAQVALGAVMFLSEWDWAGAERSLQRALEINPNHTEAHLLYGRLMETLGQPQEGLEMKLRALERDPFSPLVHLEIAMSYYSQGLYDITIEWANKTLELDPRHLLARELLAGAYLAKGDFDRHMAENIRHAESYGVPAEALEPLKHLYATGGRAAVVQYAIQHACAQPSVPDFHLAVLYSEAGDLDSAFRHLERALDKRDPSLLRLAVAPIWDKLRADPRFTQCLARMGLNPRL